MDGPAERGKVVQERLREDVRERLAVELLLELLVLVSGRVGRLRVVRRVGAESAEAAVPREHGEIENVLANGDGNVFGVCVGVWVCVSVSVSVRASAVGGSADDAKGNVGE